MGKRLMKPDYSYQAPLINQTLTALREHRKVVLAACPGAGKTVMASKIIEKLLKDRPQAKILILTHGHTLLRAQWKRQLTKFIPVHSTFEVLNGEKIPDVNIFIALPHSFKNILAHLSKIDLLIIDEAHQFYSADMVQKIIHGLKPRMQLLLTGTPALYVNKPEWKVVGITIQELLEYKTIADPTITLLESPFNLKLSQYDTGGNLSGRTILSAKKSIEAIKKVMCSLLKHLDASFHIGKTMVVCHSRAQASVVRDYLEKCGHGVVLSVSGDESNDGDIQAFKQEVQKTFLIVVNRGILGFDFPELINLVDISETMNVNRLFQMLCRVVRADPSGRAKCFYKLGSPILISNHYLTMSFVVGLSDPKYYFNYSIHSSKDKSLTNIHLLNVPVPGKFLEAVDHAPDRTKIPLIALPQLLTFTELKRKLVVGGLDSVAETSFRRARYLLSHNDTLTLPRALELMKTFKNRTEFSEKEIRAYLLVLKKSPDLMDQQFPLKNIKWNLKLAEIKKFCKSAKSMDEIRSSGFYDWAYKNGHKGLFAHLLKKKPDHKIEECLQEARKFEFVGDFKREKRQCYSHIQFKKRLDEISFLKRKKQTFDPAVIKKIVSLSKKMGLTQACQKFGLSYHSVYQHLNPK